MTQITSMKEPLLKRCLLETVPACPNVVVALRAQGFASAESALTGRTSRVHCKSIVVGDVVLYSGNDDNDVRVGEVFFHANLDGKFLVGLSNWPVKRATSQRIKAFVQDELIVISTARLLQSAIYTQTAVGKLSTVLVPQ